MTAESLFGIHDGCTYSDCIDLGVASPPENPEKPAAPFWEAAWADPHLAAYPPPLGLPAFINAISRHYEEYGLVVPTDRIIVTAGAHAELALWGDKLVGSAPFGVMSPRYPAPVAAMRASNAIPIEFEPNAQIQLRLPDSEISFLYVCSPHNPTGESLNSDTMAYLVEQATNRNITIFYDNVYACFEHGPLFNSAFHTPGASSVVVEFNSLSKSCNLAGFRIGWVVVTPDAADDSLVQQRAAIAYGEAAGVDKIAQMLGELALTPQGYRRAATRARGYRRSGMRIREALERTGLRCTGGDTVPLVWVQSPGEMSGVELWHLLHDRCHINTSPGLIFGLGGEHSVRVSGFCLEDHAREAATRIEGRLTNAF